jgi:hypothetical protein
MAELTALLASVAWPRRPDHVGPPDGDALVGVAPGLDWLGRLPLSPDGSDGGQRQRRQADAWRSHGTHQVRDRPFAIEAADTIFAARRHAVPAATPLGREHARGDRQRLERETDATWYLPRPPGPVVSQAIG